MFNGESMVENIKTLCREHNIKISDLEKKIGVSKGNISRWAKSCPSPIISLSQIATILNTSVDYILNIECIPPSKSDKNSTLNTLIEKTINREVEWEKISYTKGKKIPIINCTNEPTYNNNVQAYSSFFKNNHLIFVFYHSTDNCELYIEDNNEYIIVCNNDSYAKRLKNAINNKKQNILKDFFNA